MNKNISSIIFHKFLLTTLTIFLISTCSTPDNSPPTLAALTSPPDQYPTSETSVQSMGGGEPRSPGYWLIWNTCVEENQAEVARANGGREAGWIIMDDLLIDPGILVGTLTVETCEQGANLLQERDTAGTPHENDSAYTLAAQLFTAQLNLAIGSEYCPASDQAVRAGQLLLLTLSFSGSGVYLGPPAASPDVEHAKLLTEQLSGYNSGALCR